MDSDPIFQVLLGYRAAATLRAAIELDCFSAIAEGKRTPAQISASRGGSERSIRILLDALAAIAPKILRKAGGHYALTPLSRKFLVRTGREFVGRLMPLYGHPMMWDAFHDLPQAVRSGTSVKEHNAHTPNQPFWEDFARATAEDAVPKAKPCSGSSERPLRPARFSTSPAAGAHGAVHSRRGSWGEVDPLRPAPRASDGPEPGRRPPRFHRRRPLYDFPSGALMTS
jgi:hypothetical protein